MAPSKVITESQQQQQQQQKVQQKMVSSVMSKISGRISTRSQTTMKAAFENKFTVKDLSKRKADQLSPPKGKTTKRSALTDININAAAKTNANDKGKANNAKKVPVAPNPKQKELVKVSTATQSKAQGLVSLKSSSNNSSNTASVTSIISQSLQSKTAGIANVENVDPKLKVKTLKQTQLVTIKEAKESKEVEKHFDSIQKVTSSGNLSTKFRRSLDNYQEKSDDSSLYTSAVEDISQCDESSKILSPPKKPEEKEGKKPVKAKESSSSSSPVVPQGVNDFDKENLHDPSQVSNYAMDIFNYMKDRESIFKVQDYMPRQVVISKWMRSLLVDWMVEVQENFELNHETLYLGVKITDIYLNKVVVAKEILQLIGAAALFIAAKYDERVPPLIDDFIYICENAFTREDIIKMEINVFKVIDFNLGMPLSYRFLRRFARCCKATMPILTLARYVLELSLMEYQMIFVSESKIACAALFLALRMKNISGWTPTLEYYSGYKLSDFKSIVLDLNAMLRRKPKEHPTRIRNKYSHKIFFEVAKTPLIEDKDLFAESSPRGESASKDKL